MSNEIKLRAWFKADAEWVDFTLSDIAKLGSAFMEYEHWRRYTGLHDSKGVEIYEGDILTNERNSALWEARWDSKMAAFYASERRWAEHPMYIAAWTLTNKQVIGNIYQHPHLLGGDKETA